MMQIRLHGTEEEIGEFLRELLKLDRYKAVMGPAFSDLLDKGESYRYGNLTKKETDDKLANRVVLADGDGADSPVHLG